MLLYSEWRVYADNLDERRILVLVNWEIIEEKTVVHQATRCFPADVHAGKWQIGNSSVSQNSPSPSPNHPLPLPSLLPCQYSNSEEGREVCSDVPCVLL